MPRKGQRHTPESRRAISRGVRRSITVRRAREPARPMHVDQWRREGQVAPELRLILDARADQAERLVEHLGGPEYVSAMQRGVLETWLQAQVAADVEFARLVKGEVTSASG